MGGSSSINALMWIRGSRHDYDLWSKLGANGWNYTEVLPYFLRMENNQDKERVKSGKLAKNFSSSVNMVTESGGKLS